MDVYLQCHHCGSEIVGGNHNVTHNLTAIADKVGLYKPLWRPEEVGITKAKDLIPLLITGIQSLNEGATELKKLEPENGWGTLPGFISFCQNLLKDCVDHPEAEVIVCR